LGGSWRDRNLAEWRDLIGGADFDPAQRAIYEGNPAWLARAQAAFSGERQRRFSAVPVLCDVVAPGELRLRFDPAALARVRAAPNAVEAPGCAAAPGAHRTTNAGQSDATVLCLLPVVAAPGWRVRVETERASAVARLTRSSASRPVRANGFFLPVPLSTSPGAVTVATRHTSCTWLVPAACSAEISSSISASESAFRFSGRLSVMRATGGSMWTSR
jgi:hypothetical protein